MDIIDVPQYHLAYGLLPYKRNQDVVKITPGKGAIKFVMSVVDGWNWKEKVSDDEQGRKAARFVSDKFPPMFLSYLKNDNYKLAAQKGAEVVDHMLLERWPKYVSSVATFFMSFQKQDIILSVGDEEVLLYGESGWYKPKEIGNYWLDETKFDFPCNASRFFGRGELKGNPLFSCKPDIVIVALSTPVLLATDGIKDVLSLQDIFAIVGNPYRQTPKQAIESLSDEIQKRKTQQDDISILVRWNN